MLRLLSPKAYGSKDFCMNNPSSAKATFGQSTYKNAKIFENHLNPVMLVFIGYLSLSTLIWVPTCQSFSHLLGFLYHFVLTKLATNSIRLKTPYLYFQRSPLETEHRATATESSKSAKQQEYYIALGDTFNPVCHIYLSRGSAGAWWLWCLASKRDFASLSPCWIPISGLAWSLYKCVV